MVRYANVLFVVRTKEQTPTKFVNRTALVDICLQGSWSEFYKLKRRGQLPPPDGTVVGKPIWLESRLEELKEAIA
jgi:hypothetical protein